MLNKTDLVPPEQLGKIKQQVLKIANEDKKIVECTYGQLDAEVLFNKRIQSLSIKNLYKSGEHHHRDHSTVQTIKLEDVPPLQQKTVAKWFKQLPPTILRGKGYIEFEGSNHLYSFQYASRKISFAPVPSASYRKPIVILIGMGIDEEQMRNYCMPLLE